MTKLIKPMLLSTQENVDSNPECLYEPKYDGFRLLASNELSYTRHGTITTSRLPELHFAGEAALMDGELIAPGENSPDDFAGAMSRFQGNKNQPILYKAFDLLYYQGNWVTMLPIQKRKELLAELIENIDCPYIQNVPYVVGEGEKLFQLMKDNNMEGIVAKRLGSPYIPATRSKEWGKIICWSYYDVICTKVMFNPLNLQLVMDGTYVGSVSVGFTKKIRREVLSVTPPFSCHVKARGWTSGGKLRLPQVIRII